MTTKRTVWKASRKFTSSFENPSMPTIANKTEFKREYRLVSENAGTGKKFEITNYKGEIDSTVGGLKSPSAEAADSRPEKTKSYLQVTDEGFAVFARSEDWAEKQLAQARLTWNKTGATEDFKSFQESSIKRFDEEGQVKTALGPWIPPEDQTEWKTLLTQQVELDSTPLSFSLEEKYELLEKRQDCFLVKMDGVSTTKPVSPHEWITKGMKEMKFRISSSISNRQIEACFSPEIGLFLSWRETENGIMTIETQINPSSPYSKPTQSKSTLEWIETLSLEE